MAVLTFGFWFGEAPPVVFRLHKVLSGSHKDLSGAELKQVLHEGTIWRKGPSGLWWFSP